MPEHLSHDDARAQLIAGIRALAAAGPLTERLPAVADGRRPRESAVLILLGALDDVPAASGGGTVADDLDLLLVQRAATLSSHPGQVAFPGGRLDPPDGDPDDPRDAADLPGGSVPRAYVRAALREAREETGLDPEGVEVLGALPRAQLAVSGHAVVPVVGWWTRPTPVDVVDHGESALVFRAPVADLLDPRRRHTARVTRGGQDRPRRHHRSPAFEVPRRITDAGGGSGQVTVWGFTGIILDRLLEACGWTRAWDEQDVRPAPLLDARP